MADDQMSSAVLDAPRFTRGDCALLAAYQTRRSWLDVPDDDQQRLRELWRRVTAVAQAAATRFSGATVMRHFRSALNPNGGSPKDYWCCVHPARVPNKSFGLQVALIISPAGGELLFCVGAGTSQERDPVVIERNQAALKAMRARLNAVPATTITTIANALDAGWCFRKHWRAEPGTSDFARLDEWIAYATAPEAAEASVSRNFTAAELEDLGTGILDQFLALANTFAPLIDDVYAEDSHARMEPELPATPTDSRIAEQRTWCIAAGRGGVLWPELWENGIVAIGARGLRVDLSTFEAKDELLRALLPLSDDGVTPTNEALCCWQFAREMRPGDRLLVKRGLSEILGYGVVAGPYNLDVTRETYPHIRKVRWITRGSWTLPEDRRVPQKTLTDVSDYPALLEFILPLVDEISNGSPSSPANTPELPLYSIDDALNGLFIESDEFARMVGTLARKRNVILQGPPGVGKTFVAKRLAYALMGYKAPSRVEMVQFHQSYAYEDFVQGLRPTEAGGFSRQDGPFHRFCERARQDGANTYVFIIDEINRGNLSKIFGEMMMLIEADKRTPEYAMALTYARPGEPNFYVPENVYIIGMMNTADRSLAMVDYALRRRFSFIRLQPSFDSPKFRAYLLNRGAQADLVARVIDRMGELNETITSEAKHLGPGYEIGHSFFCAQGTEDELDAEWYKSVVVSEIEPLLEEYWLDKPSKVRQLVSQLLA